MMAQIKILNCNSIKEGSINISFHKLNIKYACNGVGKSTCAKAMDAIINNAGEGLNELTPFNSTEQKPLIPKIEGTDSFRKVAIFNEDYVSQYVFQQSGQGELLKNSFEVFVNNEEYKANELAIQKIIHSLKDTFNNNPVLEQLLNEIGFFIASCGKETKKGEIPASSSAGKVGNAGNIIDCIPEELTSFKSYIQGEDRVDWLKWQCQGTSFWKDKTLCPFCARPIDAATKTHLEILSKKYDKNLVAHVGKMFEIFSALRPYLTEKSCDMIQTLKASSTGFSQEQKAFIQKLKVEASILHSKLCGLKDLGFITFTEQTEDLSIILKRYKIDLSTFHYFNAENTRNQINILNGEIDKLLHQVGELQGKINKQKQQIANTIKEHCGEINAFLDSAGYKYHVVIQLVDGVYKIFLKYQDGETTISNPVKHLSYGEKNAFALLLFLYQALKENPDLIIFDDPISSFDGNKKFALINLLFMGGGKLASKTVLLLTHDFNTIVDTLYVLKHEIVPTPIGYFLTNNGGILEEKLIEKHDIMSCTDVCNENIANCKNKINKLIYIRKLCELYRERKLEWDWLSSLFHKRTNPTKYDRQIGHIDMTVLEIKEAEKRIRTSFGVEVNYSEDLRGILDTKKMIELYLSTTNNYEKLQIYRIINNKNHENKIIKKFVNETFHGQNENLFQLNPLKFDMIPQYIIDICNQDIDKLKTIL